MQLIITGEIYKINILFREHCSGNIPRRNAQARHGLLLTPTKSVVTFTSRLCVTVIARNAVLKHLTTARARTLRAHNSPFNGPVFPTNFPQTPACTDVMDHLPGMAAYKPWKFEPRLSRRGRTSCVFHLPPGTCAL